ncbi:MAG: ATP-binding cassette domain-containing protein, partial [Caldilinea sp.]
MDQVDISARPGVIRAVIGENGAGKSTLMKMLTGDIRPDAGTLFQAERPVVFHNPRQANLQGIAMVHQELQLMPLLSVIDNLMLVNPPDAFGIRRRSRAEREYVQHQLARVGLHLDPSIPVSTLSVAQAQLLEIAKALALNARVIIFDEPTSALPLHEVERLLSLIEGLRAEGHAILYISHHLPEVTRLADVITVMRDTRVVGEFRRGEFTEPELIRLMVAREVGQRAEGRLPFRAEVVLAATQVATAAVQGVTFDLHQGEILGFAGLMGSGMQAAASGLAGA